MLIQRLDNRLARQTEAPFAPAKDGVFLLGWSLQAEHSPSALPIQDLSQLPHQTQTQHRERKLGLIRCSPVKIDCYTSLTPADNLEGGDRRMWGRRRRRGTVGWSWGAKRSMADEA